MKKKSVIKLTARQLEVLYDIVGDTRHATHYGEKDFKAINKLFDKLDGLLSIAYGNKP